MRDWYSNGLGSGLTITAMQATPQKVFLVDDDPFCLNLMKHVMKTNGFADVHTYEGGAACLNSLTDEPDIIFLDYAMGSVSGIDTLKAIKRYNPDIYVVLVSGQHELDVAVYALKLGAFDYIVKDEHLNAKVGTVLTKIRSIGELLATHKAARARRLLPQFSFISVALALLAQYSFFPA